MASRPPPRFVVRPHDASVGRRRVWLGAAWLASLLVVGLVVGGIAHHGTPVAAEERQLKALTKQNNDLQQQVANLQRAGQVADIANASLRKTLSEREEEISGLRADLGFYSRLTGGDAQREGLKVQEVRLQPVENSHAWNLTLSVTQNAKRGDDVVIQVAAGDEISGFVKRFVGADDETTTVHQLNPDKDIKYPTANVRAVHLIVGSLVAGVS